MPSDEEAARRLHLEINGGRRRYVKRSQGQGVASPVQGGTPNYPSDNAQAIDTDIIEKREKPGKPLATSLPLLTVPG